MITRKKIMITRKKRTLFFCLSLDLFLVFSFFIHGRWKTWGGIWRNALMSCWSSEDGAGDGMSSEQTCISLWRSRRRTVGDKRHVMVIVRPSSSLTELPGSGAIGSRVSGEDILILYICVCMLFWIKIIFHSQNQIYEVQKKKFIRWRKKNPHKRIRIEVPWAGFEPAMFI